MQYRKQIFFLVGARPQFIKLAPVLAEMKKYDVDVAVVHTGQHYDYELSEIFFQELGIPAPLMNLQIGSAEPHIQYASILTSLGDVLTRHRPDALVVIGDTHSTGAGAVCAALHKIPLIHIEAGLREWDKTIPEEINKMITDTLSDLMLCPTQTAVNNLESSGVRGRYFLTGDPGLDLVRYWKEHRHLSEKITSDGWPEHYVFATCHREANTRDRDSMKAILEVLLSLECDVLWPIHPRTRKAIREFGLEAMVEHSKIHLLEPVGFWDTQWFISHSEFVITDSGGLIKESYFHQKHVIIIDHQTEWVEVVDEGVGFVCGPDVGRVNMAIHAFRPILMTSQSLGDGFASEKIARHIVDFVHLP